MNKKTKWLIYTVLVGLIPILSRLFVWLITKNGQVEPLNASDFIAFGLVLHISNINETEHLNAMEDRSWKTIQNGLSITFIALYSVLFTLALLSVKNNDIDIGIIFTCSIVLAIVSFAISFIVFDRISKLRNTGEGND